MKEVIEDRARISLREKQKNIAEIRKRCYISGIDTKDSIMFMDTALHFRQCLSFARRILDDADFFEDEITSKSESTFFIENDDALELE